MSEEQKNADIVKRLDEIISQCKMHKQNKTLSLNYYVVLSEMENLREGNPFGDWKMTKVFSAKSIHSGSNLIHDTLKQTYRMRMIWK